MRRCCAPAPPAPIFPARPTPPTPWPTARPGHDASRLALPVRGGWRRSRRVGRPTHRHSAVPLPLRGGRDIHNGTLPITSNLASLARRLAPALAATGFILSA